VLSRASKKFAVALLVVAASFGAAIAPSSAAPPRAAAQQGAPSGTVRIAAEQELSCADWVSSCAFGFWGNWTLGNLTLPQAFVVNTDGDYEAGAFLAETPTLEPGPPMRVTYRIRPEAVWSDGEPITSADFDYTRLQYLDGGAASGYQDIESIDTTDPKVAVVTFSKTFAAWRDLFGGLQYVLPSHLLEGKNRAKLMKDGYAFSGGPWELQGGKKGWKKGRSLTLVPNDAYWGAKPQISKVIFQFIEDSAAEVQAVKTGQVLAGYPSPTEGILDQFDQESNLVYSVTFGNDAEAFYINASQFPLESQAVRQAVAYATDRQAIVEQILEPSVREGRVLQSFVVPTFKKFFTPAFEQYSLDLDKVAELMTGDGWQKNGDGVWEKGGRTAAFEVNTTAGAPSRQLTLEIWQSQLEAAGFDVKVRPLSPDVLFGKRFPSGKFDIALATAGGTPDPGLCSIFCSALIPSKDSPDGTNITRTNNPVVDAAWGAVDATLDDATRVAAAKRGQEALADYVAAIPLYQAPSIFVYDGDRLSGRLEPNTVMGPFFTMNEWVLT
jgi:peptide/nickel transport system substrate-binding protein